MTMLMMLLSLLLATHHLMLGRPAQAEAPQVAAGAVAECVPGLEASVGGSLSACGIMPSTRTLHLGPFGTITQPYDPTTGKYSGGTWEHGLTLGNLGMSYQDQLMKSPLTVESGMPRTLYHTTNPLAGVCVGYKNEVQKLLNEPK